VFAQVAACLRGGQPVRAAVTSQVVAVQAVVEKPDGQGGLYVVYFHHDQTAELQHRVPGQPTRL
jgi:hypothetical protein